MEALVGSGEGRIVGRGALSQAEQHVHVHVHAVESVESVETIEAATAAAAATGQADDACRLRRLTWT